MDSFLWRVLRSCQSGQGSEMGLRFLQGGKMDQEDLVFLESGAE